MDTATRPLTCFEIEYYGTTDHAKQVVLFSIKYFCFLENISII